MAMRSDANIPAPKRTSFASMYTKPQTAPITLGGATVGQRPISGMEARGKGVGETNPELYQKPAAPSPMVTRGRGAPASQGAGYSAGTSLGTSATGQAAAVQQPASDEDWWNSDADFQVEQGGLNSTLQSALASLASKRANYDTDFVSTLKNLGYDWEGDDAGSLDKLGSGKWDPSNKLGAYGSGLNNLNNDFAGRGMMDSSFFADALTNFNTDFNNQLSGLNTQRGQFQADNGDNTGQGLAARNEFQNALARARQNSLARRNVAI